jgi:hypothetical protein
LTIPSAGVAVDAGDPAAVLARLRDAGVVARIVDDAVVCDLRTVAPTDDGLLAAALSSAFGRKFAENAKKRPNAEG